MYASCRCGGVEIRGLEAAPITKRNPLEVPVVEKHTFIPLFPNYEIQVVIYKDIFSIKLETVQKFAKSK